MQRFSTRSLFSFAAGFRLHATSTLVGATTLVAIQLLANTASAQAQSCENLRGNLEVMPGDVALFESPTGGAPIRILSGADANTNTLAYGVPGENITIRSQGVHQSTCYRWLYVEVQASGVRGWVRGDAVKSLTTEDLEDTDLENIDLENTGSEDLNP